jgi:hypothetical protein
MKELPTDDPLFGKGTIRADGRKVHDAYLFEVKAPADVEVSGRLLPSARHHPGRRGVPSAQGRQLPAGERLTCPFPAQRGGWTLRSNRPGGVWRSPSCGRSHHVRNLRHPSQALFGQLLLGLINGSFYALLSLGLAVIFGMLNIINFTHGAQYMMGAFVRSSCCNIRARATGGAAARADHRRRHRHRDRARVAAWLYKLDHLYGLLLTFGSRSSSRAVPQPYRFRRTALPDAGLRCAAGRISASCSCRTTALGAS